MIIDYNKTIDDLRKIRGLELYRESTGAGYLDLASADGQMFYKLSAEDFRTLKSEGYPENQSENNEIKKRLYETV